MKTLIDEDVCACGCGAWVGDGDDHPWFKGPQCQRLWMLSQQVPADEQVRRVWRTDLRFFRELWMCAPWSELSSCFDDIDYFYLVQAVNAMIRDARPPLRPLRQDEVDVALCVLVHRFWLVRMGRYTGDAWDWLPEWLHASHGSRSRLTVTLPVATPEDYAAARVGPA